MHDPHPGDSTMTEKSTQCGVCEDTVKVQRNTPKKLQGGVIYHFCSEECRDRFVQDPSEFTGGRRPRRAP